MDHTPTPALPSSGSLRHTGYDLDGNRTGTVPPGRPAHGFAYDEAGRVTDYQPPAVAGVPAPATRLTYNQDHQVTQITRPDGQTIQNLYDPVSGRLTATITPEGSFTPSYSASTGNLTSLADPWGGSLAFTYDGSLPSSVTWSGAVSGSVSATYNGFFEVIEQKITVGTTTTTTAFARNRDGQLTQAGALSLAYDAVSGLPTGNSLGNTSEAMSFNGYGELVSETARYNSTVLFAETFTRDAAGRIVSRTENSAGTIHTYAYTYDLAGRLTRVEKDGSPIETYAYDANSNRTAWSDEWGSGNATFDDQDRLLTAGDRSYTYTANGELATKTQAGATAAYHYSVTGVLLSTDLPGGVALTYLHDAANRRVGKKINGTRVQGFLWSGGRVVAELDGAGNLLTTFVYAAKAHVPSYLVKGGIPYRLITDHLGAVRLVVNATTGEIAQQLEYSAFGRLLFDSNPGFQPFAFAGGLYDRHTGLVRFGARDYDPETGRWTAKDPIGFGGGDSNLYGYVVDDPVNLLDPAGADWIEEALTFLSDLSAGFGDYISFGATERVRRGLNINGVVDPCSGAYLLGRFGGILHVGASLAVGAGEVAGEGAGGLGLAEADSALGETAQIPRSLGAASRAEMTARRLGLNANSATTRQVLNNLDMPVADFIARYRQGRVLRELPGELLDGRATVEEALQFSSKVKKLLIDGRFAK
ncbi:MAG: RHS repeat-associated core domain-containing protein [Thermoanaerobaculia bacterium]